VPHRHAQRQAEPGATTRDGQPHTGGEQQIERLLARVSHEILAQVGRPEDGRARTAAVGIVQAEIEAHVHLRRDLLAPLEHHHGAAAADHRAGVVAIGHRGDLQRRIVERLRV
jgi:hypothetical protein